MDTLYKYTSEATAKKILDFKSFRYAAPSTFNDPFDIQSEVCFDFEIADLSQLLLAEIDVLVSNSAIDRHIELSTNPWCKQIVRLRHAKGSGQYQRSQLEHLYKDSIYELQRRLEEFRKDINSDWTNILNRTRVFCLSESPLIPLMWAHYADNHRGVCLGVNVMRDRDNAVCAAKEVQYSAKPSSRIGFKTFFYNILLDDNFDIDAFYHDHRLVKSNVWRHEREWRIWTLADEINNVYLKVQLEPGEIGELYFGIKSDQDERNYLIREARKLGVRTFYLVRNSPGSYELQIEEI